MQIRIRRPRFSASGLVFPASRAARTPVAHPSRQPRALGSSSLAGRASFLISLALLGAVALSACTHAAANPPATPAANASPTATPIPPVLHAYAEAVQPLMRMSVSEATALESKMRHDGLSVVGNECSTFGGDFESAQVTIRGTYTPHPAQVVYHHANEGYRLITVSTDECGLASDTNSKAEMKSAIADLRSGISLLNYAYGLTKRWTPGS